MYALRPCFGLSQKMLKTENRGTFQNREKSFTARSKLVQKEMARIKKLNPHRWGVGSIGTVTYAKHLNFLYQLNLSDRRGLKPLIFRSIFLYQLT